MVGLIDPYVIGFSVLLLYISTTYFQARAVWKQFGSVPPYRTESPAKSTASSSRPSYSAIPGRRTLISEFSRLVALTKDVKYISPGRYKGWREKHNGIRFLFLAVGPAMLTAVSGIDHRRYGWDVISSVRRAWFILPISRAYGQCITSRSVCGQPPGEDS